MKSILISRTDAIGDVVLTLPMCGWIKALYPETEVVFLGRSYTEPVVACCRHVDRFVNADTLLALSAPAQIETLRALEIEVFVHVYPHKTLARLAQKAGIPVRVGTRNRWYHWYTCNRLPVLSRRKSTLHESQLNLLLLTGLGFPAPPALAELHQYTGFDLLPTLPLRLQPLLQTTKGLNIILHPKSRGSAREWGLGNFGLLAKALHAAGHQVFVTGSPAEGDLLRDWLQTHGAFVTDLTGQMSLPEFIGFISQVDGLVACSTGPLHLAAAAGRQALGLYPPLRPIHPGRWSPLGKQAAVAFLDRACEACRGTPTACTCIASITVEAVLRVVDGWKKQTGTAADSEESKRLGIDFKESEQP